LICLKKNGPTANRFFRNVEVVALTRGAKGVTLLSGSERIELLSVPIRKEVDPTGAGDVFGVIFCIELHAGKILSMPRALPCGLLPGLSKALAKFVAGSCQSAQQLN
jgi:sugar/nucleoside kinase (ribokinase family)